MPISEFSLIERFFGSRARRALSSSVLGIGDDCALIAPTSGQLLAISTDMLVAGRHFLPDVDPCALGHKALAVNLSDLAAMGAAPRAFTLAMALETPDETWLAAFADGLFALAERFGCELVGGDTTRGPLNLCLTVFGDVPAADALRRDAARPGDDIWVSGTLGDARAGLALARGEWSSGALDEADARQLLDALERPEPRVALGLALRGVAHAALDISDGLAGDLAHILERSGVAARVDVDAVPRSRALAKFAPETQLHCALAGGDDYELCFTAPASARAAVAAAGAASGIAVTRIGTIVALGNVSDEPAIAWHDASQAPLSLKLHGFDHFDAN
ncbi:thiamine-phosphate kinase [Trinickia caryophylli]|uniref:Thiamine-monophosphate kinase n=1 Tax=Trinickia caryophylli TaxID=28094 RepID=A0A1X7CB36_TRICW|nr:thiamine-phosphate kinase [Trinickia caryophylli]PMS12427.1 thiamine-phosphate kinase [Trinickia caryophylli]TRX19625.1 thiamine-phosphate kinase [Trinickia caryophylli]WQE13060.1 thiamine-phosphate kinase [Trinickia caryophylli]SME93038.1 thiamine-phosphate kinase [Trinickia caryophylli]GLU30798.1 thiamine-monophosphate kinase [Trinickia caryophylli]